MKLYLSFAFVLVLFAACFTSVSAQADTVIGQITNSSAEVFIGGVSGNGRFVVFESRGDLATDNPRNADGNLEIFLFDYAQRRIFQITDTKAVLFDTTLPGSFSNVRVDIVNTRPVISNDGKWIAFSSNATSSTPASPDATNPGSFDGNSFTIPTPTPVPTASPTPTPSPTGTPTPTPDNNILIHDGNLEMWLYQIPAYTGADLSSGEELPVTNLSGGTFIAVTNTDPSQLPQPGSSTSGAFIADDNHDASINDDGSKIAFVSTRDLSTCVGNLAPNQNDEIFTFSQGGASACGDGSGPGIRQITKTPRGQISNPIYNKNVSIAGNSSRVAFSSTGDDPVFNSAAPTTNFDCGSNPDTSRNEEIFYADLDASGYSTGCKQITTTTPTTPGIPVNVLDLGRRMSRDGRYIAFDSFADLAGENGGTNYTSFALYLYDANAADPAHPFKRIGPRSDADSAASGGDVDRYPGFTDYDGAGTPSTIVLETRLNIKADGTIPATAADGLNPDPTRPAQIYYLPLSASPVVFTRVTKFPTPNTFLASTQPIPSNSINRLVFNLALTELGTGNSDLLSEAFYLLKPDVITPATAHFSFATGATRIPVSQTAVPTPSPTPTPSPLPSPSPTPITPSAVQGISPGMLAIVNYDPNLNTPIVSRTAVGSLSRRFNLPIELSGLSMSINGLACGLKSVGPHEITFVVPPFISSSETGIDYDLVINTNGTQLKGKVNIVPTRPDIFNAEGTIGPGGRAKLFNVTNTVHTTEPFTTTTVRIKGGVRTASKLRLYLTGIANTASSPSIVSIRIGNTTMTATAIGTGGDLGEPGVYTADFLLVPALAGAGDQPVVVSVTAGSTIFQSRLDDTTSFVRIL